MTMHVALDCDSRIGRCGELRVRDSDRGQVAGLAPPPPSLTRAWTEPMTKAWLVVSRYVASINPSHDDGLPHGGEP